MKVKHTVTAEDKDIDALFNPVVICAKTVYASVEEETAALKKARDDFEMKLNKLLCKAFKTGKKICKVKVSSKDTAMYVPPDGTVVNPTSVM